MRSHNSFIIGVIAPDEPFCNREKEQKDLISYARSGTNVLLFSPRRYGKSFLVKRILAQLEKEKALTVYIDLFPISREEDFVQRFSSFSFGARLYA